MDVCYIFMLENIYQSTCVQCQHFGKQSYWLKSSCTDTGLVHFLCKTSYKNLENPSNNIIRPLSSQLIQSCIAKHKVYSTFKNVSLLVWKLTSDLSLLSLHCFLCNIWWTKTHKPRLDVWMIVFSLLLTFWVCNSIKGLLEFRRSTASICTTGAFRLLGWECCVAGCVDFIHVLFVGNVQFENATMLLEKHSSLIKFESWCLKRKSPWWSIWAHLKINEYILNSMSF